MTCSSGVGGTPIFRFQSIMAMDEPKFLPVEPDRWAAERQYQRNDAGEALVTFRARRDECLKFLRGLKPDQWQRGGIHATRGRMAVKDSSSSWPGTATTTSTSSSGLWPERPESR